MTVHLANFKYAAPRPMSVSALSKVPVLSVDTLAVIP